VVWRGWCGCGRVRKEREGGTWEGRQLTFFLATQALFPFLLPGR
jgi:hypothetical protein